MFPSVVLSRVTPTPCDNVIPRDLNLLDIHWSTIHIPLVHYTDDTMPIRADEQEVEDVWTFWCTTGEETNSTETLESATLVRLSFQPGGLGHSKSSPLRQREGYCTSHFILPRRYSRRWALRILESNYTYLGILLLATSGSYWF